MQASNLKTRRGFTLIEMLVVIGIIVVLASLAVLVLNATGDKRAATRTADQLQGWLAQSKGRAMRDQLPRGVRLVRSQSNPNFVTGLVFLEQPDSYAPVYDQGFNQVSLTIAGWTNATPNGGKTATVSMDLTGSVNVNDMLLIGSGTENAHRITNISYGTPTTMTLAAPVLSAYGSDLTVYNRTTTLFDVYSSESSYRFIPQPRPLLGEPAFEFPKSVVIDLTQSLNLPPSYGTDGYGYPTLDILFGSSGQVIGATGGRIVLWVRDINGAGEPTLMTIYTRTGHIAAHTQGPAGQPYLYTQDGLSSGL